MEVFPKRKELASLRQLFVLHGKISIYLHALPLNAGACSGGWGSKRRFARFWVDLFLWVFSSTLTSEAMLRQECPASLFEREMEGEVWSVKKEKLFERSEFFSFSGIPDWNSSKSADGSLSFLLPFSFCCQKEKSKDNIHI